MVFLITKGKEYMNNKNRIKRLISILIIFVLFFNIFICCISKNVSAAVAYDETMLPTLEVAYSASGMYIFTVPHSGYYRIQCWGAQGGPDGATWENWYNVDGGTGAYIQADVYLEQGTVLYVNVGGGGAHATTSQEAVNNGSSPWGKLTSEGGYSYNGGGWVKNNFGCVAGTGGGATDVRIGSNDVDARFIVAGGGGGASSSAPGQGGGNVLVNKTVIDLDMLDSISLRDYRALDLRSYYYDVNSGSVKSQASRTGSDTSFSINGVYYKPNGKAYADFLKYENEINRYTPQYWTATIKLYGGNRPYFDGGGGGGGYYGGVYGEDVYFGAGGGSSFIGNPDNGTYNVDGISDGFEIIPESVFHISGVQVPQKDITGAERTLRNQLMANKDPDVMSVDTSGNSIPYGAWRGNSSIGTAARLRGVDGYCIISSLALEESADPSAPVISVTPESCDVCRNAELTIDVTCAAGLDLADTNRYQYYLSSSSTKLQGGSWTSYIPGQKINIGHGRDGSCYLFVCQISDSAGNISEAQGTLTEISGTVYHRFGPYIFDNAAPSGTVKYYENNEMLGLYDSQAAASPYAVMEIKDAADNLSGVDKIYLLISDKADPDNSTKVYFTGSAPEYRCVFNLYTALAGSEDVEKVKLQVFAVDKAGNEGPLPISAYDFGTTSDGTPILPEDIGFKETGDDGYERDDFRVEARIMNRFGETGITFQSGSKVVLEIYTFGYVEAVDAIMTSLSSQINPLYDKEINLPRTELTPEVSSLYVHSFHLPLYALDSIYMDNYVNGYKKGAAQTRLVIIPVKGTILDNIKTILK